MKKTLALVFIITSLTVAAQADRLPVPYDNLSLRGDRAYYNGNPFSGIAFRVTNGVRELEIIYDNGYKNGNHTERYKNGKKKFDYQYQNGKMIDGEYNTWDEYGNIIKTETYTNGKLSALTNYKSGIKNGISAEYYPNGKIKTEQTYSNNKLSGISKNYDEAGNLLSSKTFVNGIQEGPQVTYQTNGKKSIETNYKNGKPAGDETTYDLNGRITDRTTRDDAGNLLEKVQYTYDANGMPQSEKHYDATLQLHGNCFENWPDGSVHWRRKYNHGVIEQTIEENNVDPQKSIRTVFKNNPVAILAVVKFLPPNDWKLDHYNALLEYNLGNFYQKDRIQSNINNTIFRFRLKYGDKNSNEQLHGKVTIKNCRWETYWDTKQEFWEAMLNTQPGYRCKMSVDMLDESYMGIPSETHTVTYTSPKYPSQNEAVEKAIEQIGYKVADKTFAIIGVCIGVQSILESRKNGMAKIVTTNGGAEAGLYKRYKLTVYDVAPDIAGGTVIGKIEVIEEPSFNVAKCEIIDGEDKITPLLQSGKILKAIGR